MKKPKIGDIVLFHYREISYPAIVLSFKKDTGQEEEYLLLKIFGSEIEASSLSFSSKNWSWPEEEKEERSICLTVEEYNALTPKSLTLIPKTECSHARVNYNLYNTGDIHSSVTSTCADCGYVEEIKNERLAKACEGITENIADYSVKDYIKLRELVDKIWGLCPHNGWVEGTVILDNVQNITRLIKEYKGNK